MRRAGAAFCGLAALLAASLSGCGRSVSDLQPPSAPGIAPVAVPQGIISRRSRAPLPFFAARPRAETAYTNSDLLRNFLSIALRAEAADDFAADGSIAISKWQGPVRYRLAGAQPRDRVQIAALSQHIFVSDWGISCSQPLLAKRPSYSPSAGVKMMSKSF